MFLKSLCLTGVVAGALVWSMAAQAAPGETTGTVNMRAGPRMSYPIVARIPAGAPVEILGCRTWCEIEFAGRDGYVPANLVAALNAPAPYAYAAPPYDPFYDAFAEGPAFFFGFGGHHHDGHDRGGHGHG